MANQPAPQIVRGWDPDLGDALIRLQKAAFPPRMQFRQPETYYREALQDPANVNIVVRRNHGGLAGYLLALPHQSVWEELHRWDPEFQKEPTGLYVDIIQTLPGHRQFAGFMGLVTGLCDEARRRGESRIAMHVRTCNGLNRLTRKLFPQSRSLRRIENWFDSGEAFDYIEAVPILRKTPA